MTQELLDCLDAGLKMAETGESMGGHVKYTSEVINTSLESKSHCHSLFPCVVELLVCGLHRMPGGIIIIVA